MALGLEVLHVGKCETECHKNKNHITHRLMWERQKRRHWRNRKSQFCWHVFCGSWAQRCFCLEQSSSPLHDLTPFLGPLALMTPYQVLWSIQIDSCAVTPSRTSRVETSASPLSDLVGLWGFSSSWADFYCFFLFGRCHFLLVSVYLLLLQGEVMSS